MMICSTGLNEDEILLGEGEGGEDSDVPNTDDEDSNGGLLSFAMLRDY